MPSERQEFGTQAENQAADFLMTKGFTILDRHVTSRYGEIDILAKDGQTIVAVEVKARRTKSQFGAAVESVTDLKIEKIEAALYDVLAKRGWPEQPIRIDVVTVEPDGIEHVVGVGRE